MLIDGDVGVGVDAQPDNTFVKEGVGRTDRNKLVCGMHLGSCRGFVGVSMLGPHAYGAALRLVLQWCGGDDLGGL